MVFDIKYYPVGRPSGALIGATLMVVFGIVSQDVVYDNVLGTMDNLQTFLLLIGMMLLRYYYDHEGILPFLATIIFGKLTLILFCGKSVCCLVFCQYLSLMMQQQLY